MDDLRYIFTEPIEVDGIGLIYPFKIEDYHVYSKKIGVLTVTTKLFMQDFTDKATREEITKTMKDFDIFCIHEESLMKELLSFLSLCFKFPIKDFKFIQTDVYNIKLPNGNLINRDNYNHLRNMIIKINAIHLPKQANNKELQKHFDRDARLKNKGNKQDMEDIITTLAIAMSKFPSEFNGQTQYVINTLIARLNITREYDANIRYACAGAENVKLTSYMKHIDLFEEEKEDTSLASFQKKMGGMLK